MTKNRAKSEKKAKSQMPADGAKTLSPAPGLAIGIVGWNSSRFIESHREFLEGLKQAVSNRGGRPLYLPVSGGSDPWMPPAGTDGASGDRGRSPDGADPGRMAERYGLPSRDLIADQIEILFHEERLAGLVMVPWSINSLVGMLMATVRCGAPAIFLPHYPCWPQFSSAAEPPKISGKKGAECGIAYSQSSLLLLLEVLGLSRLGGFERIFQKKKGEASGPEKGGVEEFELGATIEWAGQRIVEMAKQKISSRRFFSPAGFHNAVTVDQALGGSSETVLHLGALAHEAGVALPLSLVNEIARKVPQLVEMNREGELTMEAFAAAGGIKPLLGALHNSLQPSPTIAGRGLSDIAKEQETMRSGFRLHKPVQEHGGLSVFFGNLAREGALFRTAGVKKERFSGAAAVKVFDSEEACLTALHDKRVKKGDALVLRYAGPKGSPGMPYQNRVARALREKRLAGEVVLLTDGRLGGAGDIAAFVQAAPEAAQGAALSVLQDGDRIFWNFADRALAVRLTDTEIRVRLSRWQEQERQMRNGFLYRYSKYSSSSPSGAVLA